MDMLHGPFDITPYVKPGGINQIAIRLDHPQNCSRWYPREGLYRSVWLMKTATVHVPAWGTFVTTSRVSALSVVVNLAITVENAGNSAALVSAATDIYALDSAGADRQVGRVHPRRSDEHCGRRDSGVARIGQPLETSAVGSDSAADSESICGSNNGIGRRKSR
jgi:beta-galactosidase